MSRLKLTPASFSALARNIAKPSNTPNTKLTRNSFFISFFIIQGSGAFGTAAAKRTASIYVEELIQVDDRVTEIAQRGGFGLLVFARDITVDLRFEKVL